MTFGREAVVSPRRLGTFKRSPKAVDAVTAPTAPVDEASGPFGSDSLAFDSPAQSPSARPKKQRPPASQSIGAANAADTRRSPLAEEVVTEVSNGVSMGAHSGASIATAVQSISHPSTASKSADYDFPADTRANGAARQSLSPAVEGYAGSRSQASIKPDAPSMRPAGGSVQAKGSFPVAENGAMALADEHGRKGSGTDAPETDLFSSNHAHGDSDATTPRFADSATAFSSSSEHQAGTAGTNGVTSSPGQHVSYSVPPPQVSSPTKAIPAASLVSAVPTATDTQQSKQGIPALVGSAPDSPKTPRDGQGRDTLTVESCQLNTGSSVHPQPTLASHQDSRHRSPTRPTSGPVTAYPGPAMSPSAHYATSYQGVTPPSSAPGFMVGRQSPAAVHAQGSPMRSPRSATRPRTPTGPVSRRGTLSSPYPPPEALEELGSTFLKYPGVLPHFMRPTASHEHRLKPEPDDTRSASPPARRPRSVAPNAHFIQPTASYVAKVAHAPSESSTPKRAMSACVVWSLQLTPSACHDLPPACACV